MTLGILFGMYLLGVAILLYGSFVHYWESLVRPEWSQWSWANRVVYLGTMVFWPIRMRSP